MIDPDLLDPEAREVWDEAFPDGFWAGAPHRDTPHFRLVSFAQVCQLELGHVPDVIRNEIDPETPRLMTEYLDRMRGRGYIYDANPEYTGGLLGADATLVQQVVEGAPLAASLLHGEHHWRAVAATGLRLAQTTPGADPQLILLFGLLHDARRLNEDYDPDHGARGAALARELAPVEGARLELLVDACARHNGGPPDPDPTIACCFDGDRLGLPRVGIPVDAAYLSTTAALDEATANWAANLHEDPPSWEDLFRWVRMTRYTPEDLANRPAMWEPSFVTALR